jgi:hypothetical protein
VARTADPKLHELWRDRIRRQADSGLTIPRFCAQECLPRASFYTWKRRFRLIDRAVHRPALPAAPAFVPVNVRVPDCTSSESLAIEADLPNGIRLRIQTANVRLACRLVRFVAKVRTVSGGSRC